MAGGHGGYREGAGRKPEGYEHPEGREDFELQRARHEKIKADQRELKLAIERGEYVSRAAVRQAASTALAILTQSVRSVPDNCERQFALAPEVVEEIQRQIDAALSEVALAFRSMCPEE